MQSSKQTEKRHKKELVAIVTALRDNNEDIETVDFDSDNSTYPPLCTKKKTKKRKGLTKIHLAAPFNVSHDSVLSA